MYQKQIISKIFEFLIILIIVGQALKGRVFVTLHFPIIINIFIFILRDCLGFVFLKLHSIWDFRDLTPSYFET